MPIQIQERVKRKDRHLSAISVSPSCLRTDNCVFSSRANKGDKLELELELELGHEVGKEKEEGSAATAIVHSFIQYSANSNENDRQSADRNLHKLTGREVRFRFDVKQSSRRVSRISTHRGGPRSR